MSSKSVDARLADIMPTSKGKAFRTTVWRRFCRGMETMEILEAFHDSSHNIPEYSAVTHDLVVDIIRGRINYYLTTKSCTVEQVASKAGQPASTIRELLNGGSLVGTLVQPEPEENPRPVRKKTKKSQSGKVRKSKRLSSESKTATINDEAADRVVVTIQAILDGEIDKSHTDIVLRGLCRYAHEERLPFADQMQEGLNLIGKIPADIALLGILDLAAE